MEVKLNSLNRDIFVSAGLNKIGTLSRDDIVAGGRLVVAEYNGRKMNSLRKCEDYKVRVDNEKYTAMSQNHKRDLFMFCAAKAYAVQGKAAPESLNEVVNDLSLSKDPNFLRTMAGIVQEVITPVLPAVMSDAGGMLMQTTTVPLGQTKEITVHSNDVFLFEDSSWGAERSVSKNYLYDGVVTLNPKPYATNGTIKWFQMVANDTDIGWYYNAIMAGLYSKLMALYTQAISAVATNQKYVPDYLQFTSYTSANWAEAIVGVQTANRLRRDQLAAYGEYRALQKVLPSGTTQDAALTYGLGLEWVQKGFLGTVGGVPLFEVTNAFVPGTVNTTGTFVYPDNMIIIAGRAGDAYAPIYTCFADGSPIVVELNPSQTGAGTIDINVTAIMDTKVVMASKAAFITGVN